jgi:hypothetical protein
VYLQWYWESEGVFFFVFLDGIFDLDHLALSLFFFSLFLIPAYFCVYSSSAKGVCVIWASWDGLILSFFCLIIVFS